MAVEQLSKVDNDDYHQRNDIYVKVCLLFDGKCRGGAWTMQHHHMYPVHDKGSCDQWNMVYVGMNDE